jgi:uncharacterized protein
MADKRAPDLDRVREPIFSLPVGTASLVYAPLHGFVTLVRNEAARKLQTALQGEGLPTDAALRALARCLLGPTAPSPMARSGALSEPLFLGIIPTRGCNMACGYCDFAAPRNASRTLDLDLARAAVDAYLALLQEGRRSEGQIHFFGGEPFRAAHVVEFVVEYAQYRAASLSIDLQFEASTNGVFGTDRAEWVADRLGTIVLSLDGPHDIQDRQRPLANGGPSFDIVCRTAKILSDGAVELIVRSCVTAGNVGRLSEWATWICGELRPSAVCFESLTSSPASAAAGLLPPDPYRFAEQFGRAARILERFGIDTIQSTTDLSECRISACPVGRDALIVSPDGMVYACYLLEREWQDHGLDLRLGHVDMAAKRFDIDDERLDRVRRLPARDKPLCVNCFCRYHCAGGCHVHHETSRPPADYDDMCVATRLITSDKLLRQLRVEDVAAGILDDPVAAAALARHADDHLLAREFNDV